MAQDGEYVYWETDGNVLKLEPTDARLNQILKDTVEEINGSPPKPAGPVNSDAASFIKAGIPAAVLGTYDREWVDRGFHSPADNLDRVVMERLPEAVEILRRCVMHYDQHGLK